MFLLHKHNIANIMIIFEVPKLKIIENKSLKFGQYIQSIDAYIDMIDFS